LHWVICFETVQSAIEAAINTDRALWDSNYLCVIILTEYASSSSEISESYQCPNSPTNSELALITTNGLSIPDSPESPQPESPQTSETSSIPYRHQIWKKCDDDIYILEKEEDFSDYEFIF
jgi:hypothetical protein